MTVETISVNPLVRARIEYDRDAESPTSWDNVGKIAYRSSRNTLGTENVSESRMDEIAAGIRSGHLIGLPVYAYVHSGAMISCGKSLRDGTIVYGNPFSCPWDSGQSGFVYTTRAKAVNEFGRKLCTQNVVQRALKCLAGEVETFSQYIEGDVYGIIVETRDDEDDEWVETDSCWGFYGFDYAKEEAKRMAEHENSVRLPA